MPAGDPLRFHHAVVAGRQEQAPGEPYDLATPVFYGTAFVLARELLATAAHVVRDAQADGQIAVMQFDNGTPRRNWVFPVADVERFDAVDLALIRCPGVDGPAIPFEFTAVPFFQPVQAIGFAFSVDPERLVFVLRAAEGHVVTRRELFHLPGQPPGYELSFRPLPGLSGAPVLVHRGQEPRVCGMVIQHHHLEQHGVAVDLGIALDAEEFLRTQSRIAGGSLAERVFGREPLPPRIMTPPRNRPSG